MTIQQTSFCSFRLKFRSGEINVNPTGKSKEGIVILSELKNPHLKYEVEESIKLVVDAAGEYEANDIFISGEKVKDDDKFVYVVNSENLNIGIISFINNVDQVPDDFFKELDILLINAGGGALFTPKQAETVYQRLSPRVAILFGFKEQVNTAKERPDLFSIEELKQDVEAANPIDKTYKVSKDDLNRIENTEVYYFKTGD